MFRGVQPLFLLLFVNVGGNIIGFTHSLKKNRQKNPSVFLLRAFCTYSFLWWTCTAIRSIMAYTCIWTIFVYSHIHFNWQYDCTYFLCRAVQKFLVYLRTTMIVRQFRVTKRPQILSFFHPDTWLLLSPGTGDLAPSVTVAPKGSCPAIWSAGPRAKCFTWTVSPAWCATNSCPPERNYTSWTNSSLFVKRTITTTTGKTQSSCQVRADGKQAVKPNCFSGFFFLFFYFNKMVYMYISNLLLLFIGIIIGIGINTLMDYYI